jgi:hypothetical protein
MQPCLWMGEWDIPKWVMNVVELPNGPVAHAWWIVEWLAIDVVDVQMS